MPSYVVSVSRVIPSPAKPIFDLLADPANHRRIDGSGTVRDAQQDASRRLGPGDRFTMSMRMGVPYRMVSTVVELEEDRLIAWQPRVAGPLGRIVGGRIWRYELEPVGGGTRVTESWDLREEPSRRLLFRPRIEARVREAMEKTLERIEEVVAAPSTEKHEG